MSALSDDGYEIDTTSLRGHFSPTWAREVAELVPERPPVCKSRSGVWRMAHAYDRDSICCFCDAPESGARPRRMIPNVLGVED